MATKSKETQRGFTRTLRDTRRGLNDELRTYLDSHVWVAIALIFAIFGGSATVFGVRLTWLLPSDHGTELVAIGLFAAGVAIAACRLAGGLKPSTRAGTIVEACIGGISLFTVYGCVPDPDYAPWFPPVYQVIGDTYLVVMIAAFALAIARFRLKERIGRERETDPSASYARYRGESGNNAGTAAGSASWDPTKEERRAHLVKIFDVRCLPDDPKPYDPYFIAICACDWVGDPCDTAAKAIRNAQKSHSDNIQPELVQPVG